MKIFTKNKFTQKILIVLTAVLLLNFGIPKPVHAVGGILLSPLSALLVTIADAFQGALEWAMLGTPNVIMHDTSIFGDKNKGLGEVVDKVGNVIASIPGVLGGNDSNVEITSKDGKINITIPESELTGTLWGLDAINVPVIYYTPEEIFSNRVPMLDINFIKPSVKGGDTTRNTAKQLQKTIAGWYNAIRLLSAVGLLSVLVYLGIRILITSVAADKAKYKKMLFDWLVGICLVFTLHYIMSFALTMAEVVTSMIAPDTLGSIHVEVTNNNGNYGFDTNLMGYVRFMIQSVNSVTGMGFLALYIMLVIYTFRFTWIYLKRVANMALLTLIAPFVALTYPIDKVADGSAQGFNMWVKEFTYNALLQPLHLLLYVVLVGSATELAVKNPIYAIVCLAFIITAEKLLRKMFGFDKASGGTVGSLAGAVGVTTLASNMLTKAAKGAISGGGKDSKVRTNDKYKREGKNPDANKDFQSFDRASNAGQAELNIGEESEDENENAGNAGNNTSQDGGRRTEDGTTPPPPPPDDDPQDTPSTWGQEQQDEYDKLDDYFNNTDNNDAYLNPQEYQAKLDRMKELEKQKAEAQKPRQQSSNEPNTAGSPDDEMTRKAMERTKEESAAPAPAASASEEPEKFETWKDMYAKDRQADYEARKQKRLAKIEDRRQRAIDRENGYTFRNRMGVGAYRTIRGIKHAAPAVAYKAARGGLRTGARLVAAGALEATAGVIAATTGDGDKTAAAMAGAAAVGFSTGDNAFEATVGKIMPDVSVRDSFGTGKYGSAIDARNAKADKEYLRSQEHKEEYEKYFKSSMTKKQYDDAVRSYRESGITDKSQIRRGLKLEQKYAKEGKDGGNIKTIRGKVQNIVQTYDNADRKAIYGSDRKATTAALKNIESQLTNVEDAKQKRAVANEILQGWRDFYNT